MPIARVVRQAGALGLDAVRRTDTDFAAGVGLAGPDTALRRGGRGQRLLASLLQQQGTRLDAAIEALPAAQRQRVLVQFRCRLLLCWRTPAQLNADDTPERSRMRSSCSPLLDERLPPIHPLIPEMSIAEGLER